jgi:3-hydroxyacyl-CoA dehydrogenase
MTEQDKQDTQKRISTTTNMSDIKKADFVIEVRNWRCIGDYNE